MRHAVHILLKESLLAMALAVVLLMPGSHEPARQPTSLSLTHPASTSTAGKYLAARFAEHNQDHEAAAEYYISALGQDAQNRELLHRSYALLAFSGEFDRAALLAARQVERAHDPEDGTQALARLITVISPLHDGKFAEAARMLLPPGEPGAFIPATLAETSLLPMHAWCDTAQGKLKQALDTLALMPKSTDAFFLDYQRLLMRAAAGDKGQALAQLEVMDFEGQPHRMVDMAVSIYRAFGEADRADTLIATFRIKEPDYQYQAPQAATGMVAQATAGMSEIMFEMAARAYRGQAEEDAAVFLRMALYLNPAFDDARLLLAHTLEQLNLGDEALALYRALPETSRFYRQAQLASASALSHLGRSQESANLLLSLAERHTQDHDALLLLGDIELSNGQYAEAAATYSRALERMGKASADDWPVFYARGICYEQAGAWDKAEPDFLKALELSPNQPSVLNYLGYSWLMLNKNVQKAEEMLRVAVAKEPGDAHILDSYGWALYKLALYNESLIFLERATLLIPDDATTNDHLGDVYWRLNRHTEAKYQWRKALAFDPPAKDRSAIQLKLEHGLAPVTPLALAE